MFEKELYFKFGLISGFMNLRRLIQLFFDSNILKRLISYELSAAALSNKTVFYIFTFFNIIFSRH
jgi:hypothetical protein